MTFQDWVNEYALWVMLIFWCWLPLLGAAWLYLRWQGWKREEKGDE